MIPIPGISFATAAKLGALAIAALALALLVHDRNRWKSTAAERQQKLAATAAAFDRTVAGYRAAAEQARAADAANLARVKAEQAAINERTANDFETRIASVRAAARRLREQAAAAEAHSRARRSAPVRPLPAPAGRAAQAAGQDRLPRSDRLIATEQAIQLDELLKWVKAQATVAPAKAGTPGRQCANIPSPTSAEMPACAGMTPIR